MTLILRRTHHRIISLTRSALTRIRLRTFIRVITYRVIRLRRVGTNSRHGITGPGIMTLILGCA
jgi:hypothetical protein